MDNNVRIIRLQGGEDIVADCLEDNDQLLLDNPMHLIFKRGPAGGKMMVLLPWLPIELVESNMISIPYKDILTHMQPKRELVEYYFQVVAAVNEQMNFSLNIGHDEESENKLLNELLEQALEEKKNSNIH